MNGIDQQANQHDDADANVVNVRQDVHQDIDPGADQQVIQNIVQQQVQQADEDGDANVDIHQIAGQPNVDNVNNVAHAIQRGQERGHRTQRRTQSQQGQVLPGRRTVRRARTEYDRDVRINRGWLDQPRNELQPNQPLRRSVRVSKPVEHFNISEIVCFVCKRKYRENHLVSRFNHIDRYIACSFRCFAKV